MSDNTSDIIIKGGSVELEFDETLYLPKVGDPLVRVCANKKIIQVLVTGGGLVYDSGNYPDGVGCTVRVVCG
jgi:hypothetical protein